MPTNKTKQNIRYKQAERRISQRCYPQDLAARKLCQLNEQREQYQKSIDKVFADINRRGFRPGIDNQSSEFFADFDLINKWRKEQQQIARRVDRLEKASGITTNEALRDLYLMNAGRGSQSF